MSGLALERLAEVEALLEADPREGTSEDAGDPSLRELRLWIVDGLRTAGTSLHLLVFHLLVLVGAPAPHRVGEWIGDFGEVLEPVGWAGEEASGELGRLTAALDRLMRQPVEVRRSAADLLLVLSLGPQSRRLLHLAAEPRPGDGGREGAGL